MSDFEGPCFPISDLAKGETIGSDIVEHDKTAIGGCAFGGEINAGSVGDPLSALGSTARDRPCWMSSVIVL